MILNILLVGVVVLIIGLALLLEWNKKRMGQISGPSTMPILGNVHQLGTNTKELYNAFIRFSNEFGRIYRIFVGPSKVLIMCEDANDFEIILGNVKYHAKGELYLVFTPWLGDGLLTSKGEHWHNHRKWITPAFHFKILETFVDIFASKGQTYCKVLENHIGDEAVDIAQKSSLCTLDVMIETAMQLSLNVQENEDSKYIKAIKEVVSIMMMRATRPWYHNDFIFRNSPTGKWFYKNLEIIQTYTKQIIQLRKEERKKKIPNGGGKVNEEDSYFKKKLAFLDLLLDIQEKNVTFTDNDIREEVDTFLFEGHDTTSSGLSFSLYCIAKYPDVQEKIAEELDTIFGGSSRSLTYQDLMEMNYLERVIKEVLRLYPSVPLILRVVDEDVYLKDNLKIPKGSDIGLNIERIGKNPKYWSNPEHFDPDRFLPENSRDRHPYAYVPFSAGPRNCIGQKFAMMELKSVLSSILRKYQLHDVGHKVDLSTELILKSLNGIYIGIDERK